jgi:hypothetical protein
LEDEEASETGQQLSEEEEELRAKGLVTAEKQIIFRIADCSK